jgi:hypothetical protein
MFLSVFSLNRSVVEFFLKAFRQFSSCFSHSLHKDPFWMEREIMTDLGEHCFFR